MLPNTEFIKGSQILFSRALPADLIMEHRMDTLLPMHSVSCTFADEGTTQLINKNLVFFFTASTNN